MLSSLLMTGPDSKRDVEFGEDTVADCYTKHEILRRFEEGEGWSFYDLRLPAPAVFIGKSALMVLHSVCLFPALKGRYFVLLLCVTFLKYF